MASYHGSDMAGVGQRRRLIRNLKKCVQEHLARKGIKKQNVFLVGSGCSGVAMASVLNYQLGVRWGFIRKMNDTDNHSWNGNKETTLHKDGDYVIFVDDFVSCGNTARYVYGFMKFNAVAVGHCGSCANVNGIKKWMDLDANVDIITPPKGEG